MPNDQKLDNLTAAIASLSAQQSSGQDLHFRWMVLVGFVILAFGFIINRYDIMREPSPKDLIEINAQLLALQARMAGVEDKITTISVIKQNVDECKALSALIVKEVVGLKEKVNSHVRVDK